MSVARVCMCDTSMPGACHFPRHMENVEPFIVKNAKPCKRTPAALISITSQKYPVSWGYSLL